MDHTHAMTGSSGARGRGPAREGSRLEQKQNTRRRLMDAALRELANDSFSGLSLRRVTREAGVVPGAFYRHFESMEALGLVLIDESFRALRQMLRDARAERQDYDHVIRRSAEVLVRHVQDDRPLFVFIVRERYSGVAVLRHAIRGEILLFTSELATDLARFPYLRDWSTDDLHVISALMVNSMVSIAEAVLEAPVDDPQVETEILRTAEKQLRLIALAVPFWKSQV